MFSRYQKYINFIFNVYLLYSGACIRFFKRKTHAEDLLKDKFHYTVLGLGDSNLLLDRQTTTGRQFSSFDSR